jgi:DNA-binding NtrC family response regulator
VAPDALGRLAAYSWPGNIRELENVLSRAAILSDGDEIRVGDLPMLDPDSAPSSAPPLELPTAARDVSANGRSLKQIVDDATRAVEQAALRDALTRAEGSPTKAAKLLGISRASIYNKMKEYGITP